MRTDRDVAIVGVAESDLGVVKDKTLIQLHAQAAKRALDDAGMSFKDVDGLMTTGGFAYTQVPVLAEYLGITPTWMDSTSMGGSSYEAHVAHAGAAIRAGLAEVVLITYGSTARSGRQLPGSAVRPLPFEESYGALVMTAYALAAQRHMHQYGTTSLHLAEIAVAARKWAQLNPKAFKREPLTIEEVMASPVLASPLRKLDCCLITDGGGAIIVTSAARARACRKKPVWVLGTAEACSHWFISQMPDLTTTAAAITGPLALQRAGVTHADIDVVETYDSYTSTVLVCLEDLGFCKKGEGGDFVSGGRIAPGGSFPLNTSGGGLSYTHPGIFGIFLLIEGVRQLRGECGERQVKDARLALCHGCGGPLSAHSTVILGRD